MCVGVIEKWEVSVSSSQFCCELKTAQKIKILKIFRLCGTFLGLHLTDQAAFQSHCGVPCVSGRQQSMTLIAVHFRTHSFLSVVRWPALVKCSPQPSTLAFCTKDE